MQIAVSGAGERNGCTLHLVYKSKIQQHEQRIFHMMDRGYLSVHGSTCRTHRACRHFSRRDCGNENCGMSRSRWCPWAGICCKLSDAVRSNSDWWKIRKTDCMGWWTAVSQINLAISDPAELTIVSAEWLLFQTLVVILTPSRMLVRCQLRAETALALPCEQGYVWNDVKISRPNNKNWYRSEQHEGLLDFMNMPAKAQH